jgi:hypothetical protein
MLMRVSESGDEVLIELTGVAGRQQRVLRALNACQRFASSAEQSMAGAPAQVSVRAGTNDMRIRLKGSNGVRFEASAIYRCLRHALFEASMPATATAEAH